jgi:hypothetical protein
MNIDKVIEITKAQREFMENNPQAKQPADYKNYPGKTDHVTIICIKVYIVINFVFSLTLSRVLTHSVLILRDFLIICLN